MVRAYSAIETHVWQKLLSAHGRKLGRLRLAGRSLSCGTSSYTSATGVQPHLDSLTTRRERYYGRAVDCDASVPIKGCDKKSNYSASLESPSMDIQTLSVAKGDWSPVTGHRSRASRLAKNRSLPLQSSIIEATEWRSG